MRRSHPMRLGVGVVALAFAAAACTGDDAAPDPAPDVTDNTASTSTTEAPRVDDGVLRIGVLLPQTGDGATIGLPGIAAVQQSVQAINDAGGVLGEPVEYYVTDEGSDAASAAAGIQELLENDVDAVIGPASSTVALDTVGQLMDAGILTCSPTANALALDDFPDRDLFFRTVPSDSLQAKAISTVVERTGESTATVVYIDDAYGRPFADATIAALLARDREVLPAVPIASDTETYDEIADQIAASNTGTIVILSDAAHGFDLLTALGTAYVAGMFADDRVPEIVVNDAMRRPPDPEMVTALPPAVREAVVGVSPLGIPQADDLEPAGAFAINSLNCVNLVALSALQADSDDPEEMAAQMRSVSAQGRDCQYFSNRREGDDGEVDAQGDEQCAELLADGLDINYDGPVRIFQFGDGGDPGRGYFQQFVFDDETGFDVPNGGPLLITD